MNKTDSPLKRLVQIAPQDFAEWLLKKKVIAITPANIELLMDSSRLLIWFRFCFSSFEGSWVLPWGCTVTMSSEARMDCRMFLMSWVSRAPV